MSAPEYSQPEAAGLHTAPNAVQQQCVPSQTFSRSSSLPSIRLWWKAEWQLLTDTENDPDIQTARHPERASPSSILAPDVALFPKILLPVSAINPGADRKAWRPVERRARGTARRFHFGFPAW
jgi:hypothetical protein